MKNRIFAAVLGAAFFISSAISAAPVCLQRSELAVHLAEKYGETLIAQGLDNRGRLLEIFASKSRDSWTLAETDASGRACLAAAGEYWNALESRPRSAARQPAAFPPPKAFEGETR